MIRRAVSVLLFWLAALGAVGCGLGGGGDGAKQISLRVTENFGADYVTGATDPTVPEGDSVMRFLQRSADIGTRYGGTFVQEVEGRAGGRQDRRPVDWFYYVNGIEAEVGAAERKLSAGDRVWWDLHDWGAAMRVPAVVGSFPEPFLSGSGGKRIPVRIECADPEARECDEVAERLDRAGVTSTSRSVLSQRDAGGLLRVLVGRWSQLRLDPTALRIERGPERSGVYARFDASGRRLEVLDPRGRVARTLGAGAGLVAATRVGDAQPVWLVTGTDEAGLAAAAAALDQDVLRQRFAVTIEDGKASRVPATVSRGIG
jgi:hypothetical protein